MRKYPSGLPAVAAAVEVDGLGQVALTLCLLTFLQCAERLGCLSEIPALRAACPVPASNSDKKQQNSLFSLELDMDSLLLGYRRYREHGLFCH